MLLILELHLLLLFLLPHYFLTILYSYYYVCQFYYDRTACFYLFTLSMLPSFFVLPVFLIKSVETYTVLLYCSLMP